MLRAERSFERRDDMATQRTRTIDPALFQLQSGIFDTLPPPPPLPAVTRHSRTVDWELLDLQSGIFDTLPPPPPFEVLTDSLAPMAAGPSAPPVSIPLSTPPAPQRSKRRLADAIGVAAALGIVALGIGLAPRFGHRAAEAAPAAAPAPAPAATQTAIVLQPILIKGDITPAVPRPAARASSVTSPRPIARAEAPVPDDLDLGPAPAAAPPAQILDRAEAARAVAAAALAAGACTDPDDARASMGVRVTFAPSGRVTAAQVVSGPFLGTPTGGCVARSLRGASVAPFEGPATTVSATVRIR
jgi:hypothetical protein